MEERFSSTPLSPQVEEPPIPFSNSIRLSIRQWIGLGLGAILVVVFTPALWQQVEPFPLEPDYRMPYPLSNDYWLYARYSRLAAGEYDTLLIGDSVVWGEYVTRQQTLSHYLNEQAGRERYANLGLNGAHPLALAGLIEHHATSVSGQKVLLQCNPLWLSSPIADWQEESTTAKLNHPDLVPQFFPRLPAYPPSMEKISPRLGILVEQRSPFNQWTKHLQQAYYDGSDIPGWTLEHPYDDPIGPLTHSLPPSDNSLRHEPKPWYQSGMTRQSYPWVDLEKSYQWPAFQRAVEILQRRGNQVFVLVGPFNEHHLKPKNLKQYEKVKETIAAWLKEKQIAHMVPAALPSDEYGDASHPLAAGYARLARQLKEEPFFRSDAVPPK